MAIEARRWKTSYEVCCKEASSTYEILYGIGIDILSNSVVLVNE